jgi:hypothetical protein
MSSGSHLRLCGSYIPYEYQYGEQATADRVHESSLNFINDPLVYDSADMAGTLNSITTGAAAIMEIVKTSKPYDLEKRSIDPATVKRELGILADDLANVKKAVERFQSTAEGQARWGTEDKIRVHERVITVSTELQRLEALSREMQQRSQ